MLTIRSIKETRMIPSGSRLNIMQKGPFYLSEGIKLIDNNDPDDALLDGDRILYVRSSAKENRLSYAITQRRELANELKQQS